MNIAPAACDEWVSALCKAHKLSLFWLANCNWSDVQATLLQLHASDRSQYISRNPKIYGTYSVPRLAQVMGIDSLTVRVDHSRANGLLVSGRLMGATAKGWPGESGSMISRCLLPKHTSHVIVYACQMICGLVVQQIQSLV